jgi:hypothetical protein
MAIDMLDSGKKAKNKAKVCIIGQMVMCMMVNGKMTKNMAMEFIIIQMAKSMMANGKMAKNMVMESITDQMAKNYTRENGKMTNSENEQLQQAFACCNCPIAQLYRWRIQKDNIQMDMAFILGKQKMERGMEKG